MKKIISFFCTFMLVTISVSAQVGIGTTAPDPSSMLDVTSSDRGLLPPRVSDTNAVSSPSNGLMIFDLSTNCVRYFAEGHWSTCWGTEYGNTPTPGGNPPLSCVPQQPSLIEGDTIPCANTPGLSYSVINIPGVTYIWSVPSGWSITAGQGSKSIVVTSGLLSGDISVTPSNSNGIGCAQTLPVSTVAGVPDQPSAIIGNQAPCANSLGLNYKVTKVPRVTYTWSVPSDWVITYGQGTDSITVSSGNDYGNIIVVPSNHCGDGPPRSVFVAISEYSTPNQPSAIVGDTMPCENHPGLIYSVDSVPDVIYTWTVPAGWSITAGQGSDSITVTSGNSNGVISVTPSNACHNGLSQTLAVSASSPAQPPEIAGDEEPCENTEGLIYSVVGIPGVTYTWTVPAEWSIIAGQGTDSITVTSGVASGDITVTPSNSCGIGDEQTISISTSALPPAQPSVIIGNNSVCLNAVGLIYSVDNTNGVIYHWSVPGGWIVTAGQGTNSIIANVGASSGIFNISVTPYNSCGNGSPQSMEVVVSDSLPLQPSAIDGDTLVCFNTDIGYSVDFVQGVTYNWSIPSDWSIIDQADSWIIVHSGTSSGNITVTPSNGCGIGLAQTLAVTTLTGPPAQPSMITGNITPCKDSTETYSVINVPGVTYTWQVPWSPAKSGIIEGQGTNSIVVTNDASGDIVVTPSNVCGDGPSQTLAVEVIICPRATCGGTYDYTHTVSAAGYNWLDRNLGASRVAHASDDFKAYGSLYQWGRYSDGHECINWTSSSTGIGQYGSAATQCTGTSPTDPCGHNMFVTTQPNWTTQGTLQETWWNGTTKGEADPCPMTFRIPSRSELEALNNSFSPQSVVGAFNSPVKMTSVGQRQPENGDIWWAGSEGGYWSSTYHSPGYASYYMYFSSFGSNVGYADGGLRTYGYSVRCISE